MNILKALNWRYAVKQFSDEKIKPDQLQQLLSATHLSASSYGLQPYAIIVVKSDKVRQQLLPYSYGQNKVADCSHLIIFAAHTNIGDLTVERYINRFSQVTELSRKTLVNMSEHVKSAISNKTKEQQQEWAHQQAYIALGNLLTCAALMKIDTCPMTGIDFNGYDKVLGLTQRGLTTSVICPVGIRHPDDKQATTPKVRFKFDELVSVI